jgi:hypothetical protein
MYIYCIYSRYILYRSIHPLVVYSYVVYNEAVNSQTLRKYTILNGNFVFDLHYVFQEHNPGVKRDPPVNYFYNVYRPDNGLQKYADTCCLQDASSFVQKKCFT